MLGVWGCWGLGILMDLGEVMLGGFDYNFDFSRCCMTKPFSTTFPWSCFNKWQTILWGRNSSQHWNLYTTSLSFKRLEGRASAPRFVGVLHSWWRVQTSTAPGVTPPKHGVGTQGPAATQHHAQTFPLTAEKLCACAFAVYILTVLATSPNGLII